MQRAYFLSMMLYSWSAWTAELMTGAKASGVAPYITLAGGMLKYATDAGLTIVLFIWSRCYTVPRSRIEPTLDHFFTVLSGLQAHVDHDFPVLQSSCPFAIM